MEGTGQGTQERHLSLNYFPPNKFLKKNSRKPIAVLLGELLLMGGHRAKDRGSPTGSEAHAEWGPLGADLG